MDEKRSESRHRTFHAAILTYYNGHAAQPCTVRNLSPGGALIEMHHPAAPESLLLDIPSRGLRLRGRPRWQEGGKMGVHFAVGAAVKAPNIRDASY